MLLIVVLSIGFKDKTISNRFTGFFLPSFADGAKQSAVTFFVLFFYYFSFYFFLEGDQVTRKKITEVASRREKEKEKETEKKTEPPKTFEDLRKFLKKKN